MTSNGFVGVVVVLVFVTGVVLGVTVDNALGVSSVRERPSSSFGSTERVSPADRIRENQVRVEEDRVMIDLAGRRVGWARYTNSNSMDPVFDVGHNGLEVVPESQGDVYVGDVVAYASGEDLVVHRVVEVGYDEGGWFAVTKGDNNVLPDPGRRRFSEIRAVMVGVLY